MNNNSAYLEAVVDDSVAYMGNTCHMKYQMSLTGRWCYRNHYVKECRKAYIACHVNKGTTLYKQFYL